MAVFGVARQKLGVAPILDPADVVEGYVDDFSLQAYLTELYKILEKAAAVAVSGLVNDDQRLPSRLRF